MTSEMTATQTSLNRLLTTFIEQCQDKLGSLPSIEHDSQWPSKAEMDTVEEGKLTRWQPYKIEETLTFSNVETALEQALHPSIKEYFSFAYSENIDANSEDGELSLLFPWNFEDFERLQQNIIGHVLMKRRLRQPLSIFFAITDEEDINLVVDNADGSVWVEPVGLKGSKKLANSLAEFLDSLKIKVPQSHV
ncbi:SecY-interacting protein [Thalassotalea litorea]|uniref:Protein Syd n=1 Tax=Thalassotalea litorea TaxID=2020715 RepID=A0A5R9IWN4_9GAMM|nr:SecY-interacting protein [Thalassotalea litorea]TLU67586.1 SecY-interacting protein [Thalassotalea litorea]